MVHTAPDMVSQFEAQLDLSVFSKLSALKTETEHKSDKPGAVPKVYKSPIDTANTLSPLVDLPGQDSQNLSLVDAPAIRAAMN